MGASTTSHLNLPRSLKECLAKYANVAVGDGYCSTAWDEYLCWPPLASGNISTIPCPLLERFTVVGLSDDPELYAVRACRDGQWINNKTDFSICIKNIEKTYIHPTQVYLTAYIILVFSVLSLISLFISLFVFIYFKTLYCMRLMVHRNLCVALILYNLTIFSLALGMLLKFHFIDYGYVCKSVAVMEIFSGFAIVVWMFLEGLLLYTRVTSDIFRQENPCKTYFCIGWGVPTVLVAIWTGIMLNCEEDGTSGCWSLCQKQPFVWLIKGPMLVALCINLFFLVNIVRVLVKRQQTCNATETEHVKKALKATAMLFPLLGLTHLIFIINPNDGGQSEAAFWIFNSFIRSSQGLIFGILYCFLNTDVQATLKNAYRRSDAQRINHEIEKRKINRACSALSQTSSTYISNGNGTKRDSQVLILSNGCGRQSQARSCSLSAAEKDEFVML